MSARADAAHGLVDVQNRPSPHHPSQNRPSRVLPPGPGAYPPLRPTGDVITNVIPGAAGSAGSSAAGVRAVAAGGAGIVGQQASGGAA